MKTSGILGGCLSSLAFIAAGAYVILIATGILPSQPGSIHTERWVLVAAGCTFFYAGLTTLVQSSPWQEKYALTHLLLETIINTLTIGSFGAVFIGLGIEEHLVLLIIAGALIEIGALAYLRSGIRRYREL